MADIMAAGMAWLTDQLQAHVSQPVTYIRGTDSVELSATFGRTMLRLADEFGAVRIEWTDRDFLIPVASLVLSDQRTLPKRGDQITHDDGTAVHTFEVLPYADEPHWRFSDPFRRMLRIHTKRITTEAV